MEITEVVRQVSPRKPGRVAVFRRVACLAACGAVLACAAGCVIAPVPYRQAPMPPQPPVYMAPVYPSPGVEWVWVFEPSFGWGWHHPGYGRYHGGGSRRH
jgi:hypothetical protein